MLVLDDGMLLAEVAPALDDTETLDEVTAPSDADEETTVAPEELLLEVASGVDVVVHPKKTRGRRRTRRVVMLVR